MCVHIYKVKIKNNNMKKTEELWKIIPRTQKLYQVSTLGRIRDKKTEQIMEETLEEDGYMTVTVYLAPRRVKVLSPHKCVLKAFTPSKKLPGHKNKIKTDNRLENLEWVTWEEYLKQI